jgi:hypothetical protein
LDQDANGPPLKTAAIRKDRQSPNPWKGWAADSPLFRAILDQLSKIGGSNFNDLVE